MILSEQDTLPPLNHVLCPWNLFAIGLVHDSDAHVVEHEQVVLRRLHQFRRERCCIWAAAVPDVASCLAWLRCESHEDAALLSHGHKTLAAASALQSVAASVQHEVVGSIRCFATKDR